MAVAFDAKATTVTGDIGNSGTATNTTLTIGGTGSLVIGVFSSANNGAGALATPTAMTWNGVAMTLIGNKTDSSTDSNVYIYGLVSPATGNHTLSCTYNTSASATNYLDCFSFSGTETSSIANCCPAANVITDASTTTTANYPSTAFSVTTVSGDAACAAFDSVVGGNNFSTVTQGTQINYDNANNGQLGDCYALASGTSTSLQFGGGASGSVCCGVALRIQQPTGGGGLTLNPQNMIMM
jgi:hypothetical protein